MNQKLAELYQVLAALAALGVPYEQEVERA